MFLLIQRMICSQMASQLKFYSFRKHVVTKIVSSNRSKHSCTKPSLQVLNQWVERILYCSSLPHLFSVLSKGCGVFKMLQCESFLPSIKKKSLYNLWKLHKQEMSVNSCKCLCSSPVLENAGNSRWLVGDWLVWTAAANNYTLLSYTYFLDW